MPASRKQTLPADGVQAMSARLPPVVPAQTPSVSFIALASKVAPVLPTYTQHLETATQHYKAPSVAAASEKLQRRDVLKAEPDRRHCCLP